MSVLHIYIYYFKNIHLYSILWVKASVFYNNLFDLCDYRHKTKTVYFNMTIIVFHGCLKRKVVGFLARKASSAQEMSSVVILHQL